MVLLMILLVMVLLVIVLLVIVLLVMVLLIRIMLTMILLTMSTASHDAVGRLGAADPDSDGRGFKVETNFHYVQNVCRNYYEISVNFENVT